MYFWGGALYTQVTPNGVTDQEAAVRRAVPMDRDFAALNGLMMRR